MLDYKGILTNITGFAKSNFQGALRRGRRNSTNTSVTSTETNSSASTSKKEEGERRGRDREAGCSHIRLSSEEARTTTIMGHEAREDGIYTDENDAESPFVVVAPSQGNKNAKKNVEGAHKKKEGDQQRKKKKTRRALNIPRRNMFASDFVIRPDGYHQGFSSIDSEYDSEEDFIDPRELMHCTSPGYPQPLGPPLMGMNPDIPNEYDPVIGIISIQGVKIPRSQPIDILPPREPLFPFFGVNGELEIMLISELMFDVYKERIRVKGKEQMLNMMENMAMSLTCGQMCGRLVPVELMDDTVLFYDYETVSFLTKDELVNLLQLCEPDDVENSVVAESYPSVFHRETPEQMLERNKFYQFLMERPRIYLRRNFFEFNDFATNEQTERMMLDRQLKDQKLNPDELADLIRTISQDLEETERLQGVDFVRRCTLALYDARVKIPSVKN
ncbi:hypothetical protein CAEBREN_01926 [Caenorhabditis brenneri]|uniref:Uncharacterized protein n=1 Tax=Caenorhabditis brenneri TaxID=135651 RepID=G0MGR6_CAEBE|nr:hypothetical protein CAEBREN_01926 [Caenorhabditis brenneri]